MRKITHAQKLLLFKNWCCIYGHFIKILLYLKIFWSSKNIYCLYFKKMRLLFQVEVTNTILRRVSFLNFFNQYKQCPIFSLYINTLRLQSNKEIFENLKENFIIYSQQIQYDKRHSIKKSWIIISWRSLWSLVESLYPLL